MQQVLSTFILCFLIGSSALVSAQNGPGGVGNTSGTSSLKLWLKADGGVTTISGQVSTWSDFSGNSNNVTNSSISERPAFRQNGANGMPYVQFDGSNDFLEMSGPSNDFNSTEASIFVVGDGSLSSTVISIAQTGIVQEMLVRGNAIFHHSSSGNYNRIGHQCVGNIANTEARILGAVFGTAVNDLQFSTNGLASTSLIDNQGGSNYSAVSRIARIGRRGNGEHLNGNLYEVIVYDRKLTAVEQDSVENYLRCKYDIDNNGCGSLSTSACSAGTGLQDGPGGVGSTDGTSSLKLWLKADAGVTNASGSVSDWADQSGNNNDVANSSAIARPSIQQNGANGMPYVQFDGSNDFLVMGSARADFSNTESSIFVVAEGSLSGTVTSVYQTGIVQEMLVRGNSMFHHSSSGNFRTKGHQCIGNIASTEARIIGAVFGTTNTDIEFYANGLASSQGTSGPGGVNYINVNRAVRLGSRSNGEYLNGRIYEVIIYDRKLTAIEQDSVEEYLRCRYNVVNNTCGSLSTAACGTMMSTTTALPASSVELFPNPASHQLTIRSNDATFSRVSVLSLTGQVLKTVAMQRREVSLEVQDLPSGVYFVRLENEQQQQVLRKFIKE